MAFKSATQLDYMNTFISFLWVCFLNALVETFWLNSFYSKTALNIKNIKTGNNCCTAEITLVFLKKRGLVYSMINFFKQIFKSLPSCATENFFCVFILKTILIFNYLIWNFFSISACKDCVTEGGRKLTYIFCVHS